MKNLQYLVFGYYKESFKILRLHAARMKKKTNTIDNIVHWPQKINLFSDQSAFQYIKCLTTFYSY